MITDVSERPDFSTVMIGLNAGAKRVRYRRRARASGCRLLRNFGKHRVYFFPSTKSSRILNFRHLWDSYSHPRNLNPVYLWISLGQKNGRFGNKPLCKISCIKVVFALLISSTGLSTPVTIKLTVKQTTTRKS